MLNSLATRDLPTRDIAARERPQPGSDKLPGIVIRVGDHLTDADEHEAHRPMRGILMGVVLGAACWAVLIGVFMLF